VDARSVPITREELHRLIIACRFISWSRHIDFRQPRSCGSSSGSRTRRTARVAAGEETDRGIAAMSNARAYPVLKDGEERALRTSPGGQTVAPHRTADALTNVVATLAAVEAFVNDVLSQSQTSGRRPSAGDKR
jgi:hypothetical protein